MIGDDTTSFEAEQLMSPQPSGTIERPVVHYAPKSITGLVVIAKCTKLRIRGPLKAVRSGTAALLIRQSAPSASESRTVAG